MTDSKWTVAEGETYLPSNPTPGDRVRQSAVLRFGGGEVTIPKPTRADLILSAAQWVTRAREELQEIDFDGEHIAHEYHNDRNRDSAKSALDHVTRILKELSE